MKILITITLDSGVQVGVEQSPREGDPSGLLGALVAMRRGWRMIRAATLATYEPAERREALSRFRLLDVERAPGDPDE